MPLKLVTGPANSGRAGVVMNDYRARLAEEPILVVPAFRDVEHSLRELAEKGAVFGAEVKRFRWLFDEIADRCGSRGASHAEVQRAVVVAEAVRSSRLERAARLRSAPRLHARGGPVRVGARALDGRAGAARARARRSGPRGGARAAYAHEVASVYRAYRERLDIARHGGRRAYAWRAVNSLRDEPQRWGRTPVFVYGFDDFTPIELDALETLAGRAEADVLVSLPYERGGPAFKAVAPVFEELSGSRATSASSSRRRRTTTRPSRARRCTTSSAVCTARPTEGVAGRGGAADARGRRARRGGAGGRRGAADGALRHARGRHRGRVPQPGAYASLVEQVFGAYGIPFSIDR